MAAFSKWRPSKEGYPPTIFRHFWSKFLSFYRLLNMLHSLNNALQWQYGAREGTCSGFACNPNLYLVILLLLLLLLPYELCPTRFSETTKHSSTKLCTLVGNIPKMPKLSSKFSIWWPSWIFRPTLDLGNYWTDFDEIWYTCKVT